MGKKRIAAQRSTRDMEFWLGKYGLEWFINMNKLFIYNQNKIFLIILFIKNYIFNMK